MLFVSAIAGYGKFKIEHHIGKNTHRLVNGNVQVTWNANTVIRTKSGTFVVTVAHRKTRFLSIEKVQHKPAEEVNANTKELFSGIPAVTITALTPDKGSVFAHYSYSDLELSMSNP